MKIAVLLPLLLVSTLASTARANFELSKNQKAVVCYGADNQSFKLNAKRTTVKYAVEGESLGPQKITRVETDDKTFVSYTTSEGTLTLKDKRDTYRFEGDSAYEVECQ